MENRDFWLALDTLVASSTIVLDRPRGTAHPRYPDDVYPYDYGYLDGTRSGDGHGIDVWIGSLPERTVTAIVYAVDLLKRDAEMKVLLGCTPEEMAAIVARHHRGSQSAMLVRR